MFWIMQENSNKFVNNFTKKEIPRPTDTTGYCQSYVAIA